MKKKKNTYITSVNRIYVSGIQLEVCSGSDFVPNTAASAGSRALFLGG